MESFILYSPYLQTVIDRLIRRDWFITCYDADIKEIYNPANYLYNIRVDNCEYKLVPDRNIFSYIVGSINRNKYSDFSRDSIGLILFCQCCEILIEPNLAVHEYINFGSANIDKALSEIEIFRAIDNYSEKPILDYFTGAIESIPITTIPNINRARLKRDFSKITWLKDWDGLYLMVLKIIDISASKKNDESKLEEFVLWMSEKYRRCLTAVIFAIYLFSQNKMSKMIKYKSSDDIEKRKADVKNMTWDFYYMSSAFRIWQNKQEREEYIFASNDKVVQKVIRAAIKVNMSGNGWPLKEEFPKEYNNIEKLLTYYQTNENRIYNSKDWTVDYRDKLILELELKLLA